MQQYKNLGSEDLQKELEQIENTYNQLKSQGLKLDMSRGKPGADQLDISNGLIGCIDEKSFKASDGTDCRNYGGLDGLPEAKKLFADLLEVNTNEVLIGGNSSLNMMYDSMVRAMFLGVYGGTKPWSALGKVRFLCPSPGYDRHFAICEQLGMEMIVIDMLQDGPDMDRIEEIAGNDDTVKGIWCTPKYSNPQGITYSDRVVERFAKLKPKAKDFRIFWDNAYIVHHLSDKPDQLLNILEACKKAGNPDMVYIFTSTSKITFPGAGIAAMAASEGNINLIKKQISIQTIGPDKLNQLRHVKFLKDIDNINEHMKKQAKILKPKFDTVLEILDEQLSGKGIAWWNKPNGGYFISLDTLDGCAAEVVSLAAQAGVTLTKAGATFPYGKDPRDRNIRIAPTYPPLPELKKAIEILAVCIRLVCARKILQERLVKVMAE